MSATIAAAIGGLQNGFTPYDCRAEVEAILADWAKWIGDVIQTSTTRLPNAIYFKSNLNTKMRGFEGTPVIILGNHTNDLNKRLGDVVQDSRSGRVIGIVICLSDAIVREIRSSDLLPKGRFVILSAGEFVDVFDSPNQMHRLTGYIKNQVPSRRLIPFSISEPAEGMMFIGRQSQLESLLYDQQDYALCGSGGMGKSSLLRQLKWTLRKNRDPRYERLVEIDLIACPADSDSAAQMIATSVYPSKRAHEVTCSDIDVFLRQRKAVDPRFSDGPIDLIIDEVDTILSLDSHASNRHAGKYPLMRALKHAHQDGTVRITLSGRTETKKLLNDQDNPFSVNSDPNQTNRSRLKLMPLLPFNDRESFQLLFDPLTELGYSVEKLKRNYASRLMRCEGIPFHIQDLGLEIAISLSATSSVY